MTAQHSEQTGRAAASEVEHDEDAPERDAARPGAEPGAPETAEDEAAALREALAAAQTETEEVRDRMLRAMAEAENTRRRAARDREEAEKYGGVRLARDILTVYDNLDRALDAVDADLRSQAAEFIEGVELTKRELVHAFAKHRIEPIAPEVGERFDPKLHQAMFEAPAPGAENGSILQVMQQGFTIAGRLLRPAMVGVAKTPQGAAGSSPGDAVDSLRRAERDAAAGDDDSSGQS